MTREPDREKRIRDALQALAQEEGLLRENLLDLLDGKLSILQDIWKISRANGVEAARRTIRASVVGHLEQIAVPTRRPKVGSALSVDDRRVQFRRVVLVLFNISSLVQDAEKEGLAKRYAWLNSSANEVEQTGVSLQINAAAARRDFEYAIAYIAKMLADGSANSSKSEVQEPSESSSSFHGYVPRKVYHKKFAQLVKQGARIIILVGQAGMGKTWLAQALVREFSDGTSEAPLIRIVDGRIFAVDLYGALAARGLNTSGLVETNSVGYLAGLLCGKNYPQYVILDGLHNAQELRGIIPQPTNSIVVATCRAIGDSVSETYSIIAVGRMSRDETADAIQRRLPDIIRYDAERLADHIQGYPLLMRHLCGLLRSKVLSARQAHADLSIAADQVVDNIMTESGDSLVTILHATAELARERDTLAFRLLILICLLPGHFPITSQYFLRAYAAEIDDSAGLDLRYARAIKALLDLSLIDLAVMSVEGGPKEKTPSLVVMHPMTRSVLCSQYIANISTVVHGTILVHLRITKEHSEVTEKSYIEAPFANAGRGIAFIHVAAVYGFFATVARAEPELASKLDITREQLRFMEKFLAHMILVIEDKTIGGFPPPELVAWVKKDLLPRLEAQPED